MKGASPMISPKVRRAEDAGRGRKKEKKGKSRKEIP